MTEQAKEARRIYKRAWCKANPERVRAAQERYWQKIADRAAADKEKTGAAECPARKTR